MTALADPMAFELPHDLEASSPPEARGIPRDAVRLMVARRGDLSLEHRHFTDLPSILQPGDVVVVNTSATIPAAIGAVTASGEPAELHLSSRLPGGWWTVELRHRQPAPLASSAWLDAQPGTTASLPAGGTATLRIPADSTLRAGDAVRLWLADVDLPEELLPYLARHGRPIRYGYVPQQWPISAYQTVFAEVPGSAEMPSAARPFSTAVTTRLAARGVSVVPFVLHCGVSSAEAHEPPGAEWFRVPAPTADAVNQARRRGNHVVAVGTTAVRALETVVDSTGTVHPGEGWTELVIQPSRKITAVDGLLTGWHEPGASHLSLLQAVAGPELIGASYREALANGYLWHEFGDSHLILP